jgi:hypothetical protein
MAISLSRRQIMRGAAALPLVAATAAQAQAPLRAPMQSEANASGMGLQEKTARRQATDELLLKPSDQEMQSQSVGIDDFIAADYAGTPVGKFLNVDKLFLRWAAPDWFEYIPDPQAPLSFVRSTGETITPKQMFTDGGSIPRWFWARKNLSPWVYVPGYLVHDWEFDLHRKKASQKSFEAVRDTLAEGLKTLMQEGLAPRDENTFRTIYAGVSSFVAKRLWNN